MIETAEVAERTVPEALERIFHEQAEFIYRTAYRVTGRAEDAEDVLQSLFARLLRGETPPEFGNSPKAYLYRAAVNLSLNLIRQRRRLVLVDVSAGLDWPTRRESRGEAEVKEALRAAIGTLTPKAAEILILRHVHGYTDAEIAALLGTSRGTIAVSLFRSRARLRKAVRDLLGEKS